MRMPIQHLTWNGRLLVAAWMAVSYGAAHSPAAARANDSREAVAAALEAALAKNIDHAREWLDQKDFKSLAQSSAGLVLFSELLKVRGENADWQQTTGKVIAAAQSVQAAARQEDAVQALAALAALEQAMAVVAAVSPQGQKGTIAKPPAIRALMLTMDATLADAKIALIASNAAAAKKQALVLSELGKLVSNSRSGEPWSALSGDFLAATQAAATTIETDPKAVRQLFRGIAQRCEACHETRGQ